MEVAPALKVTLMSLGCLVFIFSSNKETLSLITFSVSNVFCMFPMRLNPPRILLSSLKYLGDISYPLYIFHMPSLIFGFSILNIRNPSNLVVFAILISILAYHLIDRYSQGREKELVELRK